jgi:hypothetical protein
MSKATIESIQRAVCILELTGLGVIFVASVVRIIKDLYF